VEKKVHADLVLRDVPEMTSVAQGTVFFLLLSRLVNRRWYEMVRYFEWIVQSIKNSELLAF
jgi:hypothetical protein